MFEVKHHRYYRPDGAQGNDGADEKERFQIEMGSGVASQKRKPTLAVNANEANLQMVKSGVKNECICHTAN